MRKPCWRAWALMLCLGAPAHAQTLPATPIVFGDGRVTLGGDVTWSIGPDDPGFFNYTDYAHSALRMLRLAVMASVKAGDHVALLAEVRSENGGQPEPYGLYLRIRPWTARAFDIQIGRVPPTFGAFPRRAYAADNPLIGYPLAYQYLTSIRSDALPISTDELVRMRGRGWLSNFSVGNLAEDRGVPLANAFRWDTGVQVHAGNDVIDATGSLTVGNPVQPAAARRQRRTADRRARRPASDPRPHRRRIRRPRRVRQSDRRARGARRNRRGGLHADRVGRRRRVFARLLSAPVRNRGQRLDAAAVERDLAQAAAAGDRHVGRRPLQGAAGTVCRGPPRSSRLQRDCDRPHEPDLGRAGHARHDRRRLLDSAESGPEGRVSAQYARWRPRAPHESLGAAQLVFWF